MNLESYKNPHHKSLLSIFTLHGAMYLPDMFKQKLIEDVNSLEKLEELELGKLLILPQAFGNIYLGKIKLK